VKAEATRLPEVRRVITQVFADERGQFTETWRSDAYAELGIGPFVQDNVSVSRRGVLRGLHLQHPLAQAKLVSVLRGVVFDVAVDVRVGSPTFGQWVGEELSDDRGVQLFIPAGFAHGFVTLSDEVVFSYKCSTYYAPADERTVLWNDPAIGIAWPIEKPIVSPRDAAARCLADIPTELLPRF
jgi:dTDP-4-dehydrorhamnose 3,5-epimerase